MLFYPTENELRHSLSMTSGSAVFIHFADAKPNSGRAISVARQELLVSSSDDDEAALYLLQRYWGRRMGMRRPQPPHMVARALGAARIRIATLPVASRTSNGIIYVRIRCNPRVTLSDDFACRGMHLTVSMRRFPTGIYLSERLMLSVMLAYTLLQIITGVLRMMSLGIAADAVDGYFRMSDSALLESLKKFSHTVIADFADEYLL